MRPHNSKTDSSQIEGVQVLKLVNLLVRMLHRWRNISFRTANNIVIITLFKSQYNFAEHECSSNWGDYINWYDKTSHIFVFMEEKGKSGVPGKKNFSEQRREPTNSTNIKAWPNARNISTQHLLTLLGTTCCIGLATLLRYVATCWMMLDQIWKRSNFSCNILHDAWCCTRLATFTQHCYPRACALGPLLARQGPGAHEHWHVALKMMKMLRAFGHPVQHMSQHHATMLQDVALTCCERLARP